MTTAISVMYTAGSTLYRDDSSHAQQPALWWWALLWALDYGGRGWPRHIGRTSPSPSLEGPLS
jgi:hypothetical protein